MTMNSVYNKRMQQAKTGSIAPVQFISEVIAELKKVTWPTREETIKLTVMVVVISFVVGAFIGGLDILLVKITSVILKK